MEFNEFIKKVVRYNKESNVKLLEESYNFSYSFMKDKKRASGEPWINHYVDVAYEIANLKLDDQALAAALMHGILNKGAEKKDIKKIFGDEILGILENIERMNEIKKNITSKTIEIENLRKVLLSASSDLRALLIKICDKLVNLRDLNYLTLTERKRIANEAMYIYAPLAYRLGIGKIKSEIEDLAFKYTDEAKYFEISDKVEKLRKDGEKTIFKIKRQIEKELKKEEIESIVQTRVKHVYSIYKKIIEKSYDINNMSDILGIRIIVDNVEDCYEVLRIVHTTFRPISTRFKDYIAMPKPNGYRSLHTAIVDDYGKIIEFQIRTKEMHDIAEEGIAAHFNYKKISHEKEFDRKLGWLKQLVEDKERIGSFDVDFFGDQIFAFTPKGKVIELPVGSTVIDFAYHVHSDIGNRCIGANVNGKFFSLKDKIDNGDVVEILTAKNQMPSRDWLRFAKTQKARTKIKHVLKESGKVVTRIYAKAEEEKKEIEESLIKFEGDKRLKLKIAMCCKPIPGDNVVGIKSSNARLTIHKENCKEISGTGKKKIKVRWVDKFKEPIKMIVDCKDRSGLIKEILNTVSRLNIQIGKAKAKAVNDEDVECSFTVDVSTLDKLNQAIEKINKIKNVRKVYVNIA